MARNCEEEIRDHVAMRMTRRAEMQRREAGAAGNSIHFARAHYSTIKMYASQRPSDLTIRFTPTQTTCLTAPEVTEGPRYVNNELVGTLQSHNSKLSYLTSPCSDLIPAAIAIGEGVKLLMGFGVMGTSTCQQMNNTFVEIWHCTAP